MKCYYFDHLKRNDSADAWPVLFILAYKKELQGNTTSAKDKILEGNETYA